VEHVVTAPSWHDAMWIDPQTIDEARLSMVAQLHDAMFGDVWARPESPETVWLDLLERVRTIAQAVHR